MRGWGTLGAERLCNLEPHHFLALVIAKSLVLYKVKLILRPSATGLSDSHFRLHVKGGRRAGWMAHQSEGGKRPKAMTPSELAKVGVKLLDEANCQLQCVKCGQ